MPFSSHQQFEASRGTREAVLDWDDYLRRLAAFVVAQLRGDARLTDIAGEVRMHATVGSPTVRDAFTVCKQHGWNSMIYEAWALETANQVRKVMGNVPDLVAEALAAHADLPVLERDAACAWDAIADARRALYGDPEDVL